MFSCWQVVEESNPARQVLEARLRPSARPRLATRSKKHVWYRIPVDGVPPAFAVAARGGLEPPSVELTIRRSAFELPCKKGVRRAPARHTERAARKVFFSCQRSLHATSDREEGFEPPLPGSK